LKNQVSELVSLALQSLIEQGHIPAESPTDVLIEHTRDKAHGDFACNAAMRLAKLAKCNPRELATRIVENLPANSFVTKTEIAGPGFINFFVDESAQRQIINTVLEQGRAYGTHQIGAGKKVQVEFVSANPTGPLHVGHGRGAAYGSVVASLLKAAGFEVHREYYVNDAGRQMNILAASVWLRYLELCGESFAFPANGYKGDYIRDIAQELRQAHDNRFHRKAEDVFQGVPEDLTDANPQGDKEAHIDALIEKAKSLLGAADYRAVFGKGLNTILDDIRDDLAEFGVEYDEWFSEQSLSDNDQIQIAIDELKEKGFIYEEGGALWFRSTDFGDEKDRVVVRENGQMTYFASDIAYHLNKYQRGFDQLIDIWGADHHGYVPRVRAAIEALGKSTDDFHVLLVQFAILYRGGQKAQMSTRSGEFVTLRELRDEVGRDAARFFYIMRKSEQHLDFDLDLAKSQSSDNPVYYIQYAHARICSVFRGLTESGQHYHPKQAEGVLHRLDTEHEQSLIKSLARYPEVIKAAALNHEPHQLAQYLRDLANDFHTYYNAHRFLIEDEELRNARLHLISATRQVLQNGLAIIGIAAPEAM